MYNTLTEKRIAGLAANVIYEAFNTYRGSDSTVNLIRQILADYPLMNSFQNKRVAELYISMGFNKHGKTEMYRELLNHLSVCDEDRFDISLGKPGMVMIVFYMPNDDLVFKLIRDRFDTPKKTTRREVMGKYDRGCRIARK